MIFSQKGLLGWAVGASGSGLCPVVGFSISDVKPPSSATRNVVISKVDFRESGCDGR
jgi:hypothetical protein